MGHPLSMYVTRGMEVGHPKCLEMRRGGGGSTLHVYLRISTISFHVFSCFYFTFMFLLLSLLLCVIAVAVS